MYNSCTMNTTSRFLSSSLLMMMMLYLTTSIVEVNERRGGCRTAGSPQNIIGRIGGVIDGSSRIGKELKIAMEMAVQDFHASSTCSKLLLFIKDSFGKSTAIVSSVMELMKHNEVQAILLGSSTLQDASLLSNAIDKLDIPIISITPMIQYRSTNPTLHPPFLVQMNDDSILFMQCFAFIVGTFRWKKVIVIYEQINKNDVLDYSGLVTLLSDALYSVGSVIEHHIAFFPPMDSMPNSTDAYIEEQLKHARSMRSKVFLIVQSSLQFAACLFEKANQMGMMKTGFTWIISNDITRLVDSRALNKSIISNMHGVLGFKIDFANTTESFEEFKLRFRKKFRSRYPTEEEDNSNPSIFSIRAYDVTRALAKAMGKANYGQLIINRSNSSFSSLALSINIQGFSGNVSFKNGKIVPLPTFKLVYVAGNCCREVGLWSPATKNNIIFPYKIINSGMKMSMNTNRNGLSYNPKKQLRIGVPAMGAFKQFVKVSYDLEHNEPSFTGLSIQVFKAAERRLPYFLNYKLVSFSGTYDDMLISVHNKSLDAAIGDIQGRAERYKYVEFSVPYMESALQIVVTLKADPRRERLMFLKAFTKQMWMLMPTMGLVTSFTIGIIERLNRNPDFGGSSLHLIGNLLWFSVTSLSFSQKESITSNSARLVMAWWRFVVVIVAACFTANLTSMLAVPRFQPSVTDIEYLKTTNATVGCNGKSFMVMYLTNVLRFKRENIKKIDTIEDYPEAFKKGEIDAAFFIAPHAKVFLATYCQGYTKIGASFHLGGLSFAFPRGSPLARDFSEAILEVTESGAIDRMEKSMLSECSSKCSSPPTVVTASDDGTGLGVEPFFGLFMASICIAVVALLITLRTKIYNLAIENGIRFWKWTTLDPLRHNYTRFWPLSFLAVRRILVNKTGNQITGDRQLELQSSTVT